jgi:hypothetical protein
MTQWILGCIATSALLSSCAVPQKLSTMEPDRNKALVVARNYLRENRPDWYEETQALERFDVIDKGDTWEVRAPVSHDLLGGGPVVEVDKASLHVVRVYHEQ